MSFGLQVDVHGIDAIARELERLARRGQGLAVAHQKIGAAMASRLHQRFDTRTDPLGHPWVAHSAATLARYRKQDTNKRGNYSKRGGLLQRTGRMRQSSSFEAHGLGVVIGFGVPYAAFAEFGTRRMSRRRLLMADPVAGTLAPGDVDVILNTLFRHFSS